jgi:asparagine synthase (glutamine-hydrolysing)
MCGICGIVNLGPEDPPDINVLTRMMGRLLHRGPDSSGYYRDRKVGLGHTRLAIIDLETGAQPLSNKDESIWISFNGEIFNYVEIAKELTGLGHVFQTKSDTEVIVHAYEQWGISCFERFNGQWALALWDKKENRVILSRDRLGIRPLYYTICDNRLLFASEIKALFAEGNVKRSFDPKGFSEIFTFWSPVAPRTAFDGIEELKPGHVAVVHDGKVNSRPFWRISFSQSDDASVLSEDESAHLLRNHLVDASKLRFTRSDVPVGAYLSGGIDSSISSSIISNYTEAPLKTFSIRFSDSEFDEGQYQREMVNKLGAEHRDIAVSHKDIGDVFPDVIWHAERPILRTAPAPLFLLSRLVRESGYKVVVTGEGADEVMAGYDIFREAKAREFMARNPLSDKRSRIVMKLYPWMKRSPGNIPAFASAFFGKSLDTSDPGLSHRPRWNTTSSLRLMLNPDFRREADKTNVVENLLSGVPDSFNKWDSLLKAQWLEMVTLLSGYILSAQGDRMLMANSVEGRFPFLDCKFVNFAGQLPPRYKLFSLNEKHLLKIAFKDMIPDSIINRPKQPYRAPDAASFFSGYDQNHGWIADVTSEAKIKSAGVFNPKAVRQLMQKCYKVKGHNMSNTDNMKVVSVLSTMLLHHHYIEKDGGGGEEREPPKPMKIIDMINGVRNE